MPQMIISSIHTICRDPGERQPVCEDSFKHAARQHQLGGKRHCLWHSCLPAALLILGPDFRKVNLSIHEHLSFVTGISQEDPGLAIVDLARRPAVLGSHSHRFAPFLDKPGLINHHHCRRVPQVLFDQIQQVITYLICVPERSAQQFLITVGIGFSCRFGSLPTVLTLDGAEQSLQIG